MDENIIEEHDEDLLFSYNDILDMIKNVYYLEDLEDDLLKLFLQKYNEKRETNNG